MSKFSLALLVSAIISLFTHTTDPKDSVKHHLHNDRDSLLVNVHEPENDTSKVKKNPNDRVGDPTQQEQITPLHMDYPSGYQVDYELQDDLSGYNIYERMGNVDIRRPSHISFDDYVDYRMQQMRKDHFRKMALDANEENQKGLQLDINIEELEDIFGGGTISIRPTGFATLRFSIDRNKTDNSALSQRQQQNTLFNFEQNIQVGVIGQIGEKLRMNINFDTQATFDFEDQLKLEHNGTEDQILQNIAAGNVSMQVGNSLIVGRQNLFGLKTTLKFGPVYVSGIASIEQGQVQSIKVSGGGSVETPFEKEVTDYDANRHFFLSHYFRSRYEDALANLPVVQSRLQVQQVEVWVERQGFTRDNRNAVGLVDLGENDAENAGGRGRVFNEDLVQATDPNLRFPDNNSNNVYELLDDIPEARDVTSAKRTLDGLTTYGFENTSDYEVISNMRKLQSNEYTVNSALGYISLNSPMQSDQVLFVAYKYTLNGQVHQVGEFSVDQPANALNTNVLFLKMLKPSVLQVNNYPAWDLMMKNMYQIQYGINRDGFFLDVKYESGTSAGKINYLPTGPVKDKPLIQVLNIDRLTNHTAPNPDNFFDFVEPYTINTQKGLVIFPVLEPFGSHLEKKLEGDNEAIEKYVFSELYRNTQASARQNGPQFRYSLEGYFRSENNSEIPLNTFNLAEGGVVVRAGGRQLIEGQDYTVDQIGGKIIITNPSILSSGQDIEVSYESSGLYRLQNKTLLGTRVEYSPSQDLSLGGTILNLREQPFNQKTILGDEPVNNTLWGFDASYDREAPFLTKVLDKLPLYSTKEASQITAAGEFAQFLPGVPSAIRNSVDKGIVYLDDFEAAATPFTLMGWQRWQIASYPEGNNRLFNPREVYLSPLAENFSRGKFAWYTIDQAYYNRWRNRVPEEDQDNHYTRQVLFGEIFPTATRPFGSIQSTLDLRFDPTRRGFYNYQTDQARVETDGSFSAPQENWGGIMRSIDVNNDFEATNVEFIEFWMMDPFDPTNGNPNSDGGEFYLNLGLVDEDVLADDRMFREHALPIEANPPANRAPDETFWGKIVNDVPAAETFANDAGSRDLQDVGMDGLPNNEEAAFFDTIAQELNTFLSPLANTEFLNDPSSDNFVSYKDPAYDDATASILNRYEFWNGQEGNSPVSGSNPDTDQALQGSNRPDVEDVNQNGSLNQQEQYWQYRIRLHPDSLVPGSNFVVDRITRSVPVSNGNVPITWYQFRIPIRAGTPVNDISNFQSINFMRMYMTRFSEETILRMTEFQLISSQWIRFPGELAEENVIIDPLEESATRFELGAVSFEENSTKQPFNYVLPPGIQQQILNGNIGANQRENERALTLRTCNLAEGDARGIYKIVRQDLRQYKRLKMFVHAEPLEDDLFPSNFQDTGDARVFIRLGLDNDENYYEYEMPLAPSDPLLSINDPENVWPAINEFDIDLATFAQAKANRNGDNFGLIYRYRDTAGLPEGHAIIVRGTPKLSDVRNIMIGVRNPENPNGQPICLEVWVNELRLTNFDRKKGFAFNTNASFKLADLGMINASASYKSAGFGPLEQKLSTRSQEEVLRYNITANVNMDKFLPKKWGVSAPVSATYGEEQITPLFNPQEEDVTIDRLREILPEDQIRDTLRQIQDYKRTRSISFNNWKVNPQKEGGGDQGRRPGNRPTPPGRNPGGKQKQKAKMPWSISNFDFTFAYNEQEARNSTIERRYNTQHRGAINYRYTFPQVSLKPFKFTEKSEFLKKTVPFLGRFEIKPFPTNFSMGIVGDRRFEERRLRAIGLSDATIEPLFSKNFMLNRNYNLNWPITRNLQVTFNAANTGRVDEVRGYWDTATQFERDSVGTLLENLLYFGKDTARGHDRYVNFGRNTAYQHNFNVAYKLPFSQIKILNWINGTVNYTGSFNWVQAPEILPSQGGIITNNQNIQATARVDLNSLYRKVGPLKKILDGEAAFKRDKPEAPAPSNQNRPGPVTPGQEAPTEQPAVQDSLEKPDPFWFLKRVGRELIRIGLSVKNVDANFNRQAGTILPGYLGRTDNFGLDWEYVNSASRMRSAVVPPSWQFVFGGQEDIRSIAASNGWITQDTTLSSLFQQNVSDNLTARTSVEIFKGFRIDLSANRSSTLNNSEYFRYNPSVDDYNSFDPLKTGNLNMSYIFINSAFEQLDTAFLSSPFLREFSNNRTIISQRLAELDPEFQNRDNETVLGFRNGYLGSNQEVLINSFLATYGIIGPGQIELSSRPRLPLPNWNINYTGLSQLPFFKEHFNSFSIKHSYRATYTVGTFNNNLLFVDNNRDGFADVYQQVDTITNLGFDVLDTYNQFFIQGVQISEQFSPLIGINLTMKNGLTGAIDYKRSRQLTLNIGNLQLIENRTQDFSVNFRYRKNKLNLFFRAFGRDFDLQNTANFSLQLTYRDNWEVNRRIPADRVGIEGDYTEVLTRGTRNIIFDPSIEYVANKRLNIKVFFSYNLNDPFTSLPGNTFSSGGIQLRFTLAN